MNLRLLIAILLIAATSALRAAPQSIIDSPHNLSSTGPGQIHALDEDRVCIFCHTPHKSRTTAPLWNRKDSGAGYTPYDSPTLVAQPGQPTGTSKLCLSCHDGTVALGDLVSEKSALAMTADHMTGGGKIGTDLRDDHPISFAYTDSLAGIGAELAPPASWDPAVKLDAAGMLQCTTCHDAHDNEWGDFLVLPNDKAMLCRQCHTLGEFDITPHATSSATWGGTGTDPWPHSAEVDVASNACMNCHRSHHAPGAAELLVADKPEEVCLRCHDGGIAQTDVRASFAKTYRHPIVETGSAHQAGESSHNAADHVTCADCHNPHAAVVADTDAPMVQGTLRGVSGVSAAGTDVAESTYEYEVCLKCHADESSRPQWFGIDRQTGSRKMLDQFSGASPSAHPVMVARAGATVPSLIAPLNTSMMIRCSDCHGDDAGAANTTTARGTHGSRFQFILRREYRTGDTVSESPANYALCYGCHDRQSILANESFPGHRQHIVDKQTPCSACHTAHGIDPTVGNATNNAALMDFDRSVVQPLPASGILEYNATAPGGGTCTLTCHGKDHDALHY